MARDTWGGGESRGLAKVGRASACGGVGGQRAGRGGRGAQGQGGAGRGEAARAKARAGARARTVASRMGAKVKLSKGVATGAGAPAAAAWPSAPASRNMRAFESEIAARGTTRAARWPEGLATAFTDRERRAIAAAMVAGWGLRAPGAGRTRRQATKRRKGTAGTGRRGM
jgi:hypothetical protein